MSNAPPPGLLSAERSFSCFGILLGLCGIALLAGGIIIGVLM